MTLRLAYLVIGALTGAMFGLWYAPVTEVTELVWVEPSTHMRLMDRMVCYTEPVREEIVP